MEGADMDTLLSESRKELFNLRFQLATGRLDNFGRISEVKREIARILTLQTEDDLGVVRTVHEQTKARPAKASTNRVRIAQRRAVSLLTRERKSFRTGDAFVLR